MKRFPTVMIALFALTAGTVWAADAPSYPVKVTAAEAAGPVFSSPKAKKSEKSGAINYSIGQSADTRFKAGLFQAGQSDTPIESYPDDEFCYFLSGTVKLTSADGTVTDIKAGEAVLIPKGWKGRWTTPGYSKYYVIYK